MSVRVKHPNRSYATECRSHLPAAPGDLCATDLFGPLPVGRGGVRYILVILDVFSKFVKLYPLRAATTRACLNKVTGHYVTQVIQPKCILSDNGTQFSSPTWRKKLAELGIDVKFSPVRHPQANPSERCMKEIGKFCRIYCHQNHKKWPELLVKIEEVLNGSVSDSTGYSPVELMYDEPRPDLFKKFITKEADQMPPTESHQEKALKAYIKLREKATKRNRRRKVGKTQWNPQVGDLVLVKRQTVSDTVAGITGKFMRPYQGPVKISKVIPPAMYEISEMNGKVRGVFNKNALKPYQQEE